METFKEHIQEVSEAYESLKSEFTQFVVDTQPKDYVKEPISERIENIYELIQNLRNLACKKPGEDWKGIILKYMASYWIEHGFVYNPKNSLLSEKETEVLTNIVPEAIKKADEFLR
jgi:DNA-directed RNA polymerase subunit L